MSEKKDAWTDEEVEAMEHTIHYVVSVWYRGGPKSEGHDFATPYESCEYVDTFPVAEEKLRDALKLCGAAIWSITSVSRVVLVSGNSGVDDPRKL